MLQRDPFVAPIKIRLMKCSRELVGSLSNYDDDDDDDEDNFKKQ